MASGLDALLDALLAELLLIAVRYLGVGLRLRLGYTDSDWTRQSPWFWPAWSSSADAATPPGKPTGLVVNTSSGSLDVTAAWDETANTTSFKLRWRRPSGNSQEDNEAVVTVTSASFTVPNYGQWVVRLEGCNDVGCGRGMARTVTISQPSPTTPENLAVAFRSEPMSLRATWDVASGASNYKLQWRRPGAAPEGLGISEGIDFSGGAQERMAVGGAALRLGSGGDATPDGVQRLLSTYR